VTAQPRYWFSTKRYGWGWIPSSWQGWAVFVAYLVIVISVSVLLGPNAGVMEHIFAVTSLTAVLVLICWLKGGPPRWRWGGDWCWRTNRRVIECTL